MDGDTTSTDHKMILRHIHNINRHRDALRLFLAWPQPQKVMSNMREVKMAMTSFVQLAQHIMEEKTSPLQYQDDAGDAKRDPFAASAAMKAVLMETYEFWVAVKDGVEERKLDMGQLSQAMVKEVESFIQNWRQKGDC